MKAALPKKGSLLRVNQEHVQRHVTHPEWFHVFREADQVKININLFRLPMPERSLVADWAGAALQRKTSISFVFGQQPPGSARMTGALIVDMPVKQARLLLLSNAEFTDAVDKYAATQGIEPVVHTPDAGTYPPERIVTERAQILSIVLGEDEAELRFYRTSPTDMHAIIQEQKVDLVYPVVEVRMPAEELVHLMCTVKALLPEEGKP